jgi:hypothetical protein
MQTLLSGLPALLSPPPAEGGGGPGPEAAQHLLLTFERWLLLLKVCC